MSRLTFLIALLTTLSLGLPGCDLMASAPYEPKLVVSAALEAGAPLRPVTLSQTVPLGERYDPEAAAVTGATVRMERLAGNGAVVATTPYQETGPGVYAPATSEEARPGDRYRLHIETEAFGTATAETVVPTLFEIVEPPPDSVTLGVPQQGPAARLTLSDSPGRQGIYIISVDALEADSFEVVMQDGEQRFRRANLVGRYGPTPVTARFSSCEEGEGRTICDEKPSSSGSSPLLNEASYQQVGGGVVEVRLPWLSVSFYGEQRITFYALDDALVDYLSTRSIQFAPTTISPGEIPNVTTNVEGGLGFFGSYARTITTTTVLADR